jgi:hypothetical protein
VNPDERWAFAGDLARHITMLREMLMIEEAVKAFWLRYPGERP